MARGTQHRKRRPPANAGVAHAAVAPKRHKRPAYEEQLFFGRLRTHAKVLFVLMAAVFVLDLRLPRRRLRLDRDQPDRPELLQRHLRERLLALLAPEEDRRAPEGRGGLARLREQAPGRQEARRRGDRAHDLHDLKPKDADALNQLAGHLHPAGAGLGDPLQRLAAAHPGALADARSSPRSPPRSSARRSRRSRARSRAPSRAQTSSATSNEYSQVVNYLTERLGVYKQLVEAQPAGCARRS